MSFAKQFILSLYNRSRNESRPLRKAKAKRPHSRASAFVLESLETRVLMSATPMEVAQATANVANTPSAVVTTNYPDYAPGETAVITTSNTTGDGLQFSLGELVRFQVTRTDGVADAPSGPASIAPAGNAPWYVTDGEGGFTAHQQFDANGQAIDRDANGVADWIAPDNDLTVNGSISTAWYVEEQYLGASLQLTAMGQDSGAVASTAFTDANYNTTTVVTSNDTTTTYGTSVTFTATVTAAAGTNDPQGSVSFYDGATLIGTDTSRNSTGFRSGTWSIATSSLNAGTHSITAVYSGGSEGGDTFNASTSAGITQTVSKKSVTGDFNAANKTYDGTTAATVTTSLSGVVAADVGNVSLTFSTATFSSANVGNNKTVTLAGAVLSGTAASNYTLSSVGTDQADITAKALTGNFTVADKTYNGSTAATVLTRTLIGVVAGDAANVTWTNGTATFSNGNAGTGKTVTLTGASLSGTAASNYTLSVGTDTADIAALGITGNFTAANKTYDGSTAATVQTRTLTGVIAGDVANVSLSGGTATFSTSTAGIGKTVRLTGASLSGTSASNYTLTSVGTTTANITAKALTGSFTADDKIYDGSTAATVQTRTLTGVVAGDVGNVSLTGGTATFSSATVNNNKTVTLTGATLSGTAESNYTLTSVGTDQADITAKALTGSFTVADKTYNGSTAATVLTRTLVGVVAGDAANVTWTNGTATFSNGNAGIGKTVTLTGASLSGTAASNYTLSSTVTSTGNITALAITGSFTAANKTYDGTTEATVLTNILTGVLAGDVANVSLTGTATFDTANAGTGKIVTLAGATLSGTAASNYTLASLGTTTASIAKADASVTVHGFSGVYDAAVHGATGTVVGEGGVDLSAGLALGDSFSNAPGGTATWTFSGGTNYNDQSGSVAIVIAKADATVAVSGFSGVYDAAAHGATGTATGVGGVDLSAGLALGDSFSNAPGGTATWTFSGGTNYNDQSGSVAIVIAKAEALVTVQGFSGVYDAAAHGATGTAVGVLGESLSGLELGGITHTNAGIYSDSWTFTDVTGNYKNVSGTVDTSIDMADAAVTVSGYTGVYDGAAHGATGTVVGVLGESLNGLFLDSTVHTNAGSYTDSWFFAPAPGNYKNATGSVSSSIAKATATISVSGYTGVYDGVAHTATGTALGLTLGESLPILFQGYGTLLDNSPTGLTNSSSDGLSGNNGFRYVNTLFPADQEVQFTMAGAPAADSGHFVFAFLRTQNPNTSSLNGYYIGYLEAGATGTWVMGRIINNDAPSTRASGSGTLLAAGDIIRAAVVGNTVTAYSYHGGVWKAEISYTMTGGDIVSGPGYLGVEISGASPEIKLTNVLGGGYTGGTALGVLGESLSGLDLSGTTHTDAGSYTDSWTFTDSTGNYETASGTVSSSIAKADATVAVSGFSGVYDAAAHGATGTATGVGGVDLSAGLALGDSFSNVPGGTATWTFSGGTNYNDQSGSVAIVIAKADATVAVSGFSGVYDAAAHGATGTATGVGGVDLSADLALGDSFSDVPGGTATWAFSGGTNYTDQSGSVAIVIAKAEATVAVSGFSGVYDAAAHGATGTATGVGGVDLSAGLALGDSFSDVPGGTATWAFSGGTNYTDQSGSVAIVIAKAEATVSVSGFSGVYDAAAHGATGTATGVGGVDLSAGLALGDSFSDVPGGTATWAFSGGTNYTDQSGSVAIVIAKAEATVAVSGFSGVYDAAAHGATGTATGVGGVDLSAGLALGDSFSDVPGGTATWAFSGGTNYTDQSGSVAIVIAKAEATVSVSGFSGVYDAAAHGATGTATGVGGVDLSAGLALGDSFSDVPGGTATWAFSGGTNYTDQSGSVAIVIAKAEATVSVSGYSGVYDAAAHGATGTATGVGGVDLSAGLALGDSFSDVPGGTATWAFSGGTNYTDQSGSVAIVIAKAEATVSVSGYSGVYDAAAHGATGTAVGVLGESLSGLDLSGTIHTNAGTYTDTWTFTDATGNYKTAHGTVSSSIEKALATLTFGGETYLYDEEAVLGYKVTYDGITHTATGTAVGVLGESLSGLHMSGTAHRNAGTYTDTWTFTDATGNYWDTAGSISDTIYKATVTVKGYSGIYDGVAHGATVKGVLGESLSGLSSTAHTNAGSYSDSWTFTDSTGNYKNASGTVINSIAKATATVTVSRYSVTYDGLAHTATGTAKGVLGESLSGLSLSGTTHTNAGSYSDSWTFTDSTGNYKNASGTVINSIAKATATVTVSRYSVTYDGLAHTATGTAKGVLGESLSGLSLSGTTHTNAGSYTDTWTFTDVTGNYKNVSKTVINSIYKATATVTVKGYTGVYNGVAHGATGTATGVGGVDLSAGLNLGATFTNVPGGTATWTFSGGANYKDKSGSVAIVIT